MEELQRLKAAPPFASHDVGDFRFKGYVNDFMVSPRNPITQQPVPGAGVMAPPGAQPQAHPYPHPPKVPMTQSADLRSRKEESDRDIALFKQEKLQEMITEAELKKEELQEMRQHRPYGKPGAGAPIYQHDHNRRKFTEYHTQSGAAASGSDAAEKGGLQPVVQPKKSTSQPFYKTEQPGNSAVDRALTDTERRIEKLKSEMQELEASTAKSLPYIDPLNGPIPRPAPSSSPFAFFDPWGKGQGNPRRKPNGDQERYPAIKEPGIVPTVRELTHSWSHNDQPRKGNDNAQSRGSAPAVIQAPSYSQPFGENKMTHEVGTGLKVESKFGGSGEPVKTYSGSNRTRFPTTMRKDIYGNTNMTEMDGYNPFKGKAPGNPEFFPYGKPGGGAPLKDDKGKFHVQRRNVDFAHERDSSAEIGQRRRAADEYLHELQREMAVQRRVRNEANVELRAPIGELATIVQQGKVGFPKRDPTTGAILNHHHKTSDVTRAQNGIPESRMFAGLAEGNLNASLDAKNYHNELSKIAADRHKMRQLERVRDTQEELKHGETWNEFWGKPGAGAPNSNDHVFKRGKFNSFLHGVPDRNGMVVMKNSPQGIHQTNPEYYSKSTIHSNHVNMFELPIDRHRRERQAEYRPLAPFATALPN